MCGIIGVFNRKDHSKLVSQGLVILKNRGKDSSNSINVSDGTIGHCLHSVVGNISQPIKAKGIISANCEIYNWKELSEKHNIDAKNDAELLLKLLDKFDTEKVLSLLDGVYAFAYINNNILTLARDIIGEKPLWFSHSDGLAFASEKKALESLGYLDIQELNPRKIIRYDIKQDKSQFIERRFFSIAPEHKDKKKIKQDVKELIFRSIIKRIPDMRFGILLSGGVDSSLLAKVCKDLKKDFICYTAALEGHEDAPDLVYAKKLAKELGLKLKIKTLKLSQIPSYLKKVIPLIEDSNVVKAGVGLTFYAACEAAKEDNIKVIFSGLGSEEIFGGYQRHKESSNINKECVSGLLKMYERDLYRDDVITMFHNIELRLPYLDLDLVKYSLKIPSKLKIKDDMGKFILREVAEDLGLSQEFAWRKKKAAQYGSRFHKALEKLSHKEGFKLKSDYLRQFYPTHNLKLGALISGGKDSLYAAYVMQKQNYELGCFITIKSSNPDSFMYHTPNVHLAELQAKAAGIPIIVQDSKGEKELELKDLEKAIKAAKDRYKIEGIITGALYSSYQRDRIEKICDKLSLKIFSPLWHINQETYMHELIDNNFEFWIIKVAADGLSKEWLGHKITKDDIAKLAALKKKVGLNEAGEGGEYETLVISCPLFKKKIKVNSSSINMENSYTGELIVKSASLI